ncbi:hypothetical protein BDB00DRAFT_932040 [Zychaea mexicana]|uniref:uncharacterized protein n=1 Tax=Zychaea mexicana TaxID=64656 RepID=UPI0022FE061F|nr:uncharacterized protein BDB00DRAFT_932040 [Zychaea mexicana]KAI9489364.1 hypothetical protein BDB00DRAFT_932040 [Zychaea mexicana]
MQTIIRSSTYKLLLHDKEPFQVCSMYPAILSIRSTTPLINQPPHHYVDYGVLVWMSSLLAEAQSVVYAEIDRITPELREISSDLHENPELSMHEHHAHEVLTDYLEKNGFTVARHAYDMETAFMAKYTKGTGLRVGFCSEYDALPGIGHACGHNLIAVTGLANAMAMKALLDKGIASGTVVLFGTPSEEELDDKILMAKKGAFQDNVDVCSMLHPGPDNTTCVSCNAIQNFEIEFRGKPAHAGGAPWNGVNALDTICQALVNVGLLRQKLMGLIVSMELLPMPNIIPDRTTGRFCIRAPSTDRVVELMIKIENCFKAAALATGCEYTITWHGAGMCKNIVQNSVMAETYAKYYDAFGGVPIPPRQAQEVIHVGASTDFGNVSVLMPGLHPTSDVYTDAFPHTHAFAEAAGAANS